MKVYIVLIGGKGLYKGTTVGAVYTLEEHAKRECERLKAANSYTTARYVLRVVEEHCGRAPLA